MRYFVLIFSGILFVSEAAAQQAVDSSYKTTYYEQKVTQFRLLPHSKKAIVFLGDSITDIAEWAELWQNPRVKNRGISSDNTFGVLARLDEVIALKPQKIFIMIGINDIARGTPDSIIIRNHKRIYQYLRKALPGTRIYVESLLPTNNEFTEFVRHQNKTEHIHTVNQGLKDLCSEYNLVYIDLFTQFSDAEGKLDRLYTNDGLHINGSGYMLWKSILLQKGYMK